LVGFVNFGMGLGIERINIINKLQSNSIYISDNLEMISQIIIQMSSIKETVHSLLPKLEKAIQKQNSKFKFSKDEYFISRFSLEELIF